LSARGIMGKHVRAQGNLHKFQHVHSTNQTQMECAHFWKPQCNSKETHCKARELTDRLSPTCRKNLSQQQRIETQNFTLSTQLGRSSQHKNKNTTKAENWMTYTHLYVPWPSWPYLDQPKV